MERFKNKSLRNKLKATAISAIWRSHSAAFYSGKPPHEPDHVASFIINGLPALSEYWREWLSSYNLGVQITGVFCHGYPQVTFKMNGNDESVELADLLVVRRHLSGNKIVKEVATLIQSKMSCDSTKHISETDGQYYLYKNWPSFKFKQKQYSNDVRNIGRIAGQAYYSLISKERGFPEDNVYWPDCCFWSVVDNLKNNMESDESFASFLDKMIAFETGREFFSGQNTGCEWTKTIEELLSVTFNKRLKTRLFNDPKRGRDMQMFFLPSDNYQPIGIMSGGIGIDKVEDEIFDESAGISTILIETFDIEG